MPKFNPNVQKQITYSTDDFISPGDFGTIHYTGNLKLLNSNLPIVVARIQLANVESGRIQEFKDIMMKVDEHPHILGYLHIEMDHYFLFLATDQWSWTLKDFVEGKIERESIIGQEKHILRQITHGLAHLHKTEIIHRDIKPTNIIISNRIKKEICNEPVRVKLANFGICSILIKSNNKIPLGSPGWTAPESFQSNSTITPKFDVFSLGIIFYYVLTVGGKHPFGRIPLDQAVRIQKMMDDTSSSFLLTNAHCLKTPYCNDSKAIIELIGSMCEKNPEKRPTAIQVLNNTFFGQQKCTTALDKEPSPIITPQKRRIQTGESSTSILKNSDVLNDQVEIVRKSVRIFEKSANKPTSSQAIEHFESLELPLKRGSFNRNSNNPFSNRRSPSKGYTA